MSPNTTDPATEVRGLVGYLWSRRLYDWEPSG